MRAHTPDTMDELHCSMHTCLNIISLDHQSFTYNHKQHGSKIYINNDCDSVSKRYKPATIQLATMHQVGVSRCQKQHHANASLCYLYNEMRIFLLISSGGGRETERKFSAFIVLVASTSIVSDETRDRRAHGDVNNKIGVRGESFLVDCFDDSSFSAALAASRKVMLHWDSRQMSRVLDGIMSARR